MLAVKRRRRMQPLAHRMRPLAHRPGLRGAAAVMEMAGGGSLTSYVADKWQKAQAAGLFLSEDEARYFFKVGGCAVCGVFACVCGVCGVLWCVCGGGGV